MLVVKMSVVLLHCSQSLIFKCRFHSFHFWGKVDFIMLELQLWLSYVQKKPTDFSSGKNYILYKVENAKIATMRRVFSDHYTYMKLFMCLPRTVMMQCFIHVLLRYEKEMGMVQQWNCLWCTKALMDAINHPHSILRYCQTLCNEKWLRRHSLALMLWEKTLLSDFLFVLTLLQYALWTEESRQRSPLARG